MRRCIVFGIILMLALCGLLSVFAAVMGDVNGDSKVNIEDILLVRDIVFGAEATDAQEAAADVNKDTRINIEDILLIRDIIFGTPPTAPTVTNEPTPPTEPAQTTPVPTATPVSVIIITGAQAGELYQAGAILLDVRAQWEYDAGHIEGSVLIPHDKLAGRLNELPDRDTVIIVYCGSGLRSALAGQTLIDNGYTNVYDMGSINSWPGETI